MNATSSQVDSYTEQDSSARPNANMAYIAITALVAIACVCVLLLTNNRSDLWPSVAMIGSLCGFGAIMSFFVTRAK